MKKIFVILLVVLFIFVSAPVTSVAEDNSDDIAVIFSHDLHSHLDSYISDGKSVGGFARIKTIIDRTKSEYANTIVVDAGDFSMGTLYQSVFETKGAEYSMLGELGYNATVFGNHEFDYGFGAVKNMIGSAKQNASSLPPILCANIDVSASGLSESEMNNLNIKPYEIFNFGDICVAVFGLIGSDAVTLSSTSGLVFKDYIDVAKITVSEIRNLYSPDLIICLSHSGTGDDVNDEDIKLAESVPDIDLIVSGHTHTTLNKHITVGKTIIGSAGEYGTKLGKVIFTSNNGSIELKSYELVNIDSAIPEDSETLTKIEEFKAYTSEYLDRFGYESFDEILAYSPFDFPEQSQMGTALAEQQLGNLISDSYIYALKQAEGQDYVRVDVSVTPLGVVRESIDKGNVTVAKAFEISSLGIGNDGVAGYPLCSVYLYGRELWDLAEIDASVSSLMPYAQLYCSGLKYSINTNRMFLNRVYDCWLVDDNGNRVEIEDDKLYRVVSGMSSVILLGTVKEKSFGLLELTPMDENGTQITDFNKHIATDNNGAEVKEWKALADYLSSFPKNENGVPEIPMSYRALQGRKNISDSIILSQIFTNWTLISWVITAIIVVLIAIIVLSVTSIIKKKKKNKKRLISESDDKE